MNSVEFVFAHFASTALLTGVGTGYSVMKLPFTSLTLRVTPRLMVCRRRHADSTPEDSDDATDIGRA